MITCDQHDYVEIACLFRYSVRLTLKSGHEVEGVAIDVRLDDQRDECIALRNEAGVRLVALRDAASLEVTTENPRFRAVRFA